MGGTANKLSVLAAKHAEKEMAQFKEPLQDYIKTVHSATLLLVPHTVKEVVVLVVVGWR
jgi:hypothetical protein